MKSESAEEQKARNEREQAEYLQSFVDAVEIIDARYAAARKGIRYPARAPYDRLREMGAWNAKWLSVQYYLIVGKMAVLPRALRDFIMEVGAVARREYESKKREEENG